MLAGRTCSAATAEPRFHIRPAIRLGAHRNAEVVGVIVDAGTSRSNSGWVDKTDHRTETAQVNLVSDSAARTIGGGHSGAADAAQPEMHRRDRQHGARRQRGTEFSVREVTNNANVAVLRRPPGRRSHLSRRRGSKDDVFLHDENEHLHGQSDAGNLRRPGTGLQRGVRLSSAHINATAPTPRQDLVAFASG